MFWVALWYLGVVLLAFECWLGFCGLRLPWGLCLMVVVLGLCFGGILGFGTLLCILVLVLDFGGFGFGLCL